MTTQLPFDRTNMVFARRSAAHNDVQKVAAIVVSIWEDIDNALAPIIGQRGVTALFKRSLHLARAEYPMLPPIHELVILPDEFITMHTLLSPLAAEEAVEMHNDLLNIFYRLLIRFIGASLTQRLLHSVFDTPSDGDAAQDILP